jgi:ribosomal protein L11 methyltransferase
VEVPHERGEEARARMLDLFPAGFEEIDRGDGVELVAYTDAAGEERLWHAFGAVRGTEIPAGWEDEWRRFHQPVRVGGLWIGPPWETPDAGAVAVVIDPGRAFGTGAHPTTRLCIELLGLAPRGSLLDVGCGSGVLSIAAARLGFAPVVGIDVELPAVAATRANAELNRVEVESRLVDALREPLPRADVVVANITMAAVEEVAAALAGGAAILVTSGYLAADEPALPDWRRAERRTLEGWAADLWQPA